MPPKRSLTRKRQTKIAFSPTTEPSPQQHLRIVSVSSDDDDDDDVASPSRSTKRRKLEKETEKGMRLGMPVQLSGRGMFGTSDNEIEISSGVSSSDEDSEEEVQVIVSRKAKQPAKLIGGSDEEVIPASRTRHSRRKAKQAGKSEEQEPQHRSGRRRATRRASTPVDGSGGESLPAQSKIAHRRKKPIDASNEEELRSEDNHWRRKTHPSSTPEEVQTMSSRHGKKRQDITPKEESSNEVPDEENYDENDELKEDLAFLKSSPLADRGRLRSTQDKPKSQREMALEALKKRRGVTSEPSSSATPGRKKPVVIDSDSDSELEVIQEELDEEVEKDEDEGSEEDEGPEANVFEVFQENDDDEDFIDDNDALIGAPAEHISMPLQFSSLSRAKPRDLFKYAVEWMVQKKINPAFAADDEIYDLAFRKLDDEVAGLAKSKFHSSVWTPDFTRAIQARPELVINEIGHHMRATMESHCEACNRKNHTATWEASLTGKPYHKRTLEPLADDSDSSSDDDSDSPLSSYASSADLNGEKAAYNAAGERLPLESRFFALGSTCKANAQVAHTLYHWRYHLNSWVVDYLVNGGHCTPEKLVERDAWSVKKRTKYANKIVDKMEKEGEIRKLHRLYKEQVDFALEAKNEYTRGWGRSRR